MTEGPAADVPVSRRTQWLVWQVCVGTIAGLFGVVVLYTLRPVHGLQVARAAMAAAFLAVYGTFQHIKGELEYAND